MTREEAINEIKSWDFLEGKEIEAINTLIPELAESEDERIRKELIDVLHRYEERYKAPTILGKPIKPFIAWLEKQKENPKSADSIPSDCTSDARCEDRWHKVTDSLPDNGRLVLAKDCLGNVLLARYDGENWEVDVYDNEDYYCRNTITKWCEIPSEKQKPVDYDHEMWKNCEANFEGGKKEVIEHPEKYGLQKPAEWSKEDEKMLTDISWAIRHCAYDDKKKERVMKWFNDDYRKSLRPSWKPSENELAKKHLEGYIMGREDTMREMKDFIESHFNCEKAREGTYCKDYERNPEPIPTGIPYQSPQCGTNVTIVPNINSGTSTLKAEG